MVERMATGRPIAKDNSHVSYQFAKPTDNKNKNHDTIIMILSAWLYNSFKSLSDLRMAPYPGYVDDLLP